MKIFVLLAMCAVITAYEDIDDSVSFEDIVAHPPQLQAFVDCLIDLKPCDDNGAHIKRHVLDLVQHACAACDNIQKHDAHLTIMYTKKLFPLEYKLFKEKYDPKGIFFNDFEKEINKF